ncbi:MAG: hypothetical protein RIE31_08650 [Alphaproteobacteria bacterium]
MGFSTQGWSSHFVSRASHALDVIGARYNAGRNSVTVWIMAGVVAAYGLTALGLLPDGSRGHWTAWLGGGTAGILIHLFVWSPFMAARHRARIRRLRGRDAAAPPRAGDTGPPAARPPPRKSAVRRG